MIFILFVNKFDFEILLKMNICQNISINPY